MTKTYHKVGDTVYYEDSSEPGIYRKISGYDALNAPSNAVKTGSNSYNTPENIQLMKEAEADFKKQEEEQKKKEQAEASKPFAQRQAEAQAQVTSVPHVTSPKYSLSEEEIKKKIAQKIASELTPTIANNSITKIIEKIKGETIRAPALQEARIDEAMYQLQRQTQQPVETKIATPISLETKKIKVAYAGGVATILARIGTALWNFISKNPKTVGTTISTTALSNAITQTAQTEQEKNQIVKEIAQQNPQLAEEIAQTKTSPFSNIADMGKYAVIGIVGLILLYLFSQKKLIK